jgi:hypothetical protein
MKTFVLSVCALTLAIPTLAFAQKPKEAFKVSLIQQDKGADVTKFKTYAWTPGHPALLPEVDKLIVEAIDAQLAARGLTKAAKGDVLVCYHSVEREDGRSEDVRREGASRSSARRLRRSASARWS